MIRLSSGLKVLAVWGVLCMGFVLSAMGQQSQADTQKMVEAYQRMAALTENHAYFKGFVGRWEVTSSSWMQPGTEPFVGRGVIEGTLLLGGRFLTRQFKGTMMGQPAEGFQVVGFDNLKERYVALWIDNTSTAFYLTEGQYDASGKVMTENGEWPDFMTDGKLKVRAVTRSLSPDEYTYELYMAGPDGREFKTLEYRAVRTK